MCYFCMYILHTVLLDGAFTSRFGRTFGRRDRAYNSEFTSRFKATCCTTFEAQTVPPASELAAYSNWCFWCGDLWLRPFCPESLQENYWYYFRELAQEDSHLRELLRLVDQGVGDVLPGEVQAELVGTSRNIPDLRRRVTYLSICSLGVRSEPLFVPQIVSEPLRRRARL